MEHPVIYQDSTGQYDGVNPRGGPGNWFYYLNTQNEREAANKAVNRWLANNNPPF